MDLRAHRKDYIHDGLPPDTNQDQSADNIFGGVDQIQHGRDRTRSGRSDAQHSCNAASPSWLSLEHSAVISPETPVPSLLSISHEMLLSILAQLSIDDLRRCQTVCKRLRTLCRTVLLDILSTTAQQATTTKAPNVAPTMFFAEFTPNDGHTVHFRCASVDRINEELVYKPVSTDNFLTITLDMRPQRPWTRPISAGSTITSLSASFPRLLSRPAGPSVGLNLFDYQTGLRRETEHPSNEPLSGSVSSLLSHSRRPANENQEDTFTVLSIRHGMWQKEAIMQSRWDQSWGMSDQDSNDWANSESMVCLTSDLHFSGDYSSSTWKRGVLIEGSGEPPSKIHRHLVDHGANVSWSHNGNDVPAMRCRCCLHHKPLRIFAAGPVTKRIPAKLAGTSGWCLEYSLESLACCPCPVCLSRGANAGHPTGQEQEEEDDGRREVRVVMGQLRVSLDWVLSGMEQQWFKPLSRPIDACHPHKAGARDSD